MKDICDLKLPSKKAMKLYHCFELFIILFLSFTAIMFLIFGIRYKIKGKPGMIVSITNHSFEEYEILRALLFASLIAYFIGFVLFVLGFSCLDKTKVKWGFKSFLVGLISFFIFFVLYLNEINGLPIVAIPFLLIIGVTFCAILIQVRNSDKFINNLNR